MSILKNRHYYFRVFFSIIIILFIFTSLLTTSIYYSIKTYIAKIENNKSELILSQMKYNVEYMNNMIRDTCLSIYYSSDANVLMYFNGDETYNEMKLINNINAQHIQGNSLVHSIEIYNNKKKTLYTTYHSFKTKDDECIKIINNTYPLPVLKPVMRTFHDNLTGKDTTVLSYFMYDLTDSKHVMDGGIVVNVDVEWLMQSLDKLNNMSGKNEKIYLYSVDYQDFLTSRKPASQDTDEIAKIKSELKRIFKDNNRQNESGVSTFDFKSDGSQYHVLCEDINDTDWILVKVQSYLTIKDYFNQIYASLLSISGIALFLAVIAYYLITRSLYKPVRSIMEMIPKDSLSVTNDEFKIIHNTFEYYRQELDSLKSKNDSYSEIARSFFLRRLLLDSLSVTDEDIVEAKKEHQFGIDFEKPVSICLIRINGYKRLTQDNFLQDIKLAKFAVQNISKEILGEHFPCEHIDMDGDYFVLIQNPGSWTQKDLSVLLRKVQQKCSDKLDISLGITLSTTIGSMDSLTDIYNKTIYNSNYHSIFGNQSVICEEFIQNKGLSGDTGRVFELEDKLVSDFSEPMDIVLENIDMIFEELNKLEYSSIIFSIVRMQKLIFDFIGDIKSKRPDLAVEFPNVLNYNAFGDISLDEIKDKIIIIVNVIKSEMLPDVKQNKSSSIVLDVKKIIDNEYSDIDLNASKISYKIGISPSKLSSIFNRYMNMTIPEYINTVRLMKAADLLKNSDCSIAAIMQKIGISNESYFYRLFKMKYKMTPREYAANMKQY